MFVYCWQPTKFGGLTPKEYRTKETTQELGRLWTVRSFFAQLQSPPNRATSDRFILSQEEMSVILWYNLQIVFYSSRWGYYYHYYYFYFFYCYYCYYCSYSFASLRLLIRRDDTSRNAWCTYNKILRPRGPLSQFVQVWTQREDPSGLIVAVLWRWATSSPAEWLWHDYGTA